MKKIVTFINVKCRAELHHERMSDFIVDDKQCRSFFVRVTDETKEHPELLREMLIDFWYRCYPETKDQEIEFKIKERTT